MPPRLAIGHTDSAGETIQCMLPDSKVVKAFFSNYATALLFTRYSDLEFEYRKKFSDYYVTGDA